MLKQLMYSSSASPQFQPGDIGRILASCQRNNAILGITGLLIVKDNLFLQVLEGEAEAIQTVFHRIQTDSRHQDIIVINWEPIEKRVFPSWSMGFKDLNTLHRVQLL